MPRQPTIAPEDVKSSGPWTYGPDEKGRLFAVAQCHRCGRTFESGWVSGEDVSIAREEARDRVVALADACDHTNSPRALREGVLRAE